MSIWPMNYTNFRGDEKRVQIECQRAYRRRGGGSELEIDTQDKFLEVCSCLAEMYDFVKC